MNRHIINLEEFEQFECRSLMASCSAAKKQLWLVSKVTTGFQSTSFSLKHKDESEHIYLNVNDAIKAYNDI